MSTEQRVIPFDRLRLGDIDAVGGKNASLGEMIGELSGAGIRVPGGFATTAFAFREFLAHNDLEARIAARLKSLDVDDIAVATDFYCAQLSSTTIFGNRLLRSRARRASAPAVRRAVSK